MKQTEKLKRLLDIVEALRTGLTVTAEDLSQRLGVTTRTIYRDLDILKESGLEFDYDPQKQTYRLLVARFVVPTNFTLDEALSLILLGTAVKRHPDQPGLPFLHQAHSASLKLLSHLPWKLRSELAGSLEKHQIHLEPSHISDQCGEVFSQLQRASRDHQCVKLEYRSYFEQDTIRTTLKPYRLFFNKRSWYVVGHSSLHKELRTFHIGRIASLQILKKTFTIPPRFSLENYLGNAWSMIRGDQRERVVIRFEPKVASNVADVFWHKTQKITTQEDGAILFEVEVDGIDEILWWILGYGKEATVITPQSLKEKIAIHAQSMLEKYAP